MNSIPRLNIAIPHPLPSFHFLFILSSSLLSIGFIAFGIDEMWDV